MPAGNGVDPGGKMADLVAPISVVLPRIPIDMA
jgi:hypothetical protein